MKTVQGMLSVDDAVSRAERIQGFTPARDLRILARGVHDRRPDRLLEIGAWRGRTTELFLALGVPLVVSVDDWSGLNGNDPLEGLGPVSEAREDFLLRFGLDARVVPVPFNSRSLEAEHHIRKYAPYGMVFVDGQHRAEDVESDIRLALKYGDKDCLICGHDVRAPPVRTGMSRVLGSQFQEAENVWWVYKESLERRL